MTDRDKYNEWRATAHGEEVFELCREFSVQIAGRGFTNYSIWAVANAVRWHRNLKHGPDGEDFKISNNHLAYLARELMVKGHVSGGFFRTKSLKEDAVIWQDNNQAVMPL